MIGTIQQKQLKIFEIYVCTVSTYRIYICTLVVHTCIYSRRYRVRDLNFTCHAATRCRTPIIPQWAGRWVMQGEGRMYGCKYCTYVCWRYVCMYSVYITTYGYKLTLKRNYSIGIYPVVPVLYRYKHNYHTLLSSRTLDVGQERTI